jgi:hypothetical protein
MTTETRTFIGKSGTPAFNGCSGFRIGQQYQLRIERQDDSTVAIGLDHAHYAPGVKPMVVSSDQFEKWFKRS